MKERIHVAAGVIVNGAGDILIARRPAHVHQGGLWEFPGGKVESGERADEALKRELHEELGISVGALRPLIHVHFDYPDKSVFLDVWRVEKFSGLAHGREGQPIRWVSPAQLASYEFPAANLPIVRAARLPDACLVTPDPGEEQDFLSRLAASLARGTRLVQLRAHHLDDDAYSALAEKSLLLCRQHAAQLLLNRDPSMLQKVDADGIHLTSTRLYDFRKRPLPAEKWLGVSCHNEQDLIQASSIDADFAFIAPVKATASHPGVTPIGWDKFRELSEKAGFPVYALGGMQLSDMNLAWQNGGQGIAAITALWARD